MEVIFKKRRFSTKRNLFQRSQAEGAQIAKRRCRRKARRVKLKANGRAFHREERLKFVFGIAACFLFFLFCVLRMLVERFQRAPCPRTGLTLCRRTTPPSLPKPGWVFPLRRLFCSVVLVRFERSPAAKGKRRFLAGYPSWVRCLQAPLSVRPLPSFEKETGTFPHASALRLKTSPPFTG